MFKNRFVLVLGVLSLLLATMAVSKPFSTAPTAEQLSWPARPVIQRVSNAFSDYHERHAAADVAIPVTGSSAPASDYFQRHSELSAAAKSADLSWPARPVIIPVTGANVLSDYYERHSGLSAAAGIANAGKDDYFQRHSGQQISRAAGVAVPV